MSNIEPAHDWQRLTQALAPPADVVNGVAIDGAAAGSPTRTNWSLLSACALTIARIAGMAQHPAA